MRSRGNVIGVGTYIYVRMCTKKSLNAALSADSLKGWLKLSLALYRLMTPLKSSEALSTLDNPALSTTLSIKAH